MSTYSTCIGGGCGITNIDLILKEDKAYINIDSDWMGVGKTMVEIVCNISYNSNGYKIIVVTSIKYNSEKNKITKKYNVSPQDDSSFNIELYFIKEQASTNSSLGIGAYPYHQCFYNHKFDCFLHIPPIMSKITDMLKEDGLNLDNIIIERINNMQFVKK